ncbi:hypothetical protein [Chengkuizengella axinellae]|uniref:Helix-turn-helix domain-containing protein n=1 Tax=Chengkuizengella axinellae TaxID=3064388 RepID=A0ABT9IWR0_9BACL|nr:hypothetical protein [Chengkuizengella sp. 2205SS18-9]MDP5273804.1 hypothetical protein [Chengkuizengella sp. 2205SS18-9]
MDKRKVIEAYQRGFLSIQECAQILGLDSVKIMEVVQDTNWSNLQKKQKAK